MEITKRCRRCHEVRMLEDFHEHSKSNDGRKSECAICSNRRERRRYRSNPNCLLQNKRWMKEHPEEHKKHNSKYKSSPHGRFAEFIAKTLKKLIQGDWDTVRDITGKPPKELFQALIADGTVKAEEFGTAWTAHFSSQGCMTPEEAVEKLNWRNLQISMIDQLKDV